MAVTASANIGKKRIPANPMWSSEPSFVRDMQKVSKELTGALRDLLETLEEETPEVIMEALGPTLERAQELCPKKTGALRDSAYLEVTKRGRNPNVEIGFAKGGKPPYAVYVHEMVELKHEPPTQAKFLEVALLQDLDNIERRIEEGYEKIIGR